MCIPNEYYTHSGENQTIALYGTGLGETTSSNGYDVARAKVAVTVGGVAAKVQFAGRARDIRNRRDRDPDPAGVKAGQVNLLVYANNRVSNLVEIPVR